MAETGRSGESAETRRVFDLASVDLEHALDALKSGRRKSARSDTAVKRAERAAGYIEDAIVRLTRIEHRSL